MQRLYNSKLLHDISPSILASLSCWKSKKKKEKCKIELGHFESRVVWMISQWGKPSHGNDGKNS